MRTFRLFLWLLVGLAALAAGWLHWRQPAEPLPEARLEVSLGGPFTLVDASGQPFASSRLAGRPYAIFFGFTNCPDVCPTTLARLVKLRRQAGGDEALRIVFVTVDPERDGPAEVGRYAKLFGSSVIGLTGNPAQIDQVRKAYGTFAQKAGTGENYSVDHTATVLLFDRTGKFQSTIAAEESDEAALAKLKRLTNG